MNLEKLPAQLSDLATQISEEHRLCTEAISKGLQHALKAGELLLEAKKQVRHGNWLPWLQESFEFSVRTAQLYMRVAREYPLLPKTKRVAYLSLRGMVRAQSAEEILAELESIHQELHRQPLSEACDENLHSMSDALMTRLKRRIDESDRLEELLRIRDFGAKWQNMFAERTLRAQREAGKCITEFKKQGLTKTADGSLELPALGLGFIHSKVF